MASLNILTSDKGFTLLEIMIVMAILAVVFSFGLFISFDVYKSYSFLAEKTILVSVLQRARNQSQNNIDQAAHGVHIENNPLRYVLFECPKGDSPCQYIQNPATDIVVNASYGIVIDTPLPLDIVFDQLSGYCKNPVTIKLHAGQKFYEISITNQGQINE